MAVRSPHQTIGTIRLAVGICGVLGVALVVILAFARDDRATSLSTAAFIALFASPFLLALFSLRLHRPDHQRRVWLICALLTAIVALPLLFNGVGPFLLAIAIAFAWASRIANR